MDVDVLVGVAVIVGVRVAVGALAVIVANMFKAIWLSVARKSGVGGSAVGVAGELQAVRKRTDSVSRTILVMPTSILFSLYRTP
jgi:hypothetical protein